MREKIVAANWKMYKNTDETKSFVKSFLEKIPQKIQKHIFIFPQSVLISTLKDSLDELDAEILVGAQNCHFEFEGAFTGETSAQTLKQMGLNAVLVGHSERRALFNETDEFLSKKIQAVQNCNLIPMFCVGETLQERKSGKTLEILKRQLEVGLKHFDRKGSLIVAYEPVWAIGTGEVATPEQAQEAHQFIRENLKSITGLHTHKILYGGSVKPENAKELSLKPDIDGFLVGGASLKPESFAEICKTTLNS